MGIDRCQYCGSTLNDIISTGHVGCANCYDKFEDRLSASIERLHGKTKHLGKSITYTEEAEEDDKGSENKLDELKADLKLAIQEQRFEDAAVLRDKIKELTQED